MKNIRLGNTELVASEVSLGCMRIASMEIPQAQTLIHTAMEAGINFFDHADIYGAGQSEEVFAKAFPTNTSEREKIIIQSKCGIIKGAGMYDFSKEHILSAVDGSLKRLNTEYLDVLLLHRPDILCEPEVVAECFEQLHTQGKVRYFGVSNHNPMQIELLQKYCKQRIIINQLQFSITNTTMIDAGVNVNMENESSVNRDGSILDYCRLKDITIQPWSPMQYGFFKGVFIDNPEFPELNAKLDELATQYGASKTTIAIAFILRHPAKMQPIIGTTNAERVRQSAAASDIRLTASEWYAIYRAAGNRLP